MKNKIKLFIQRKGQRYTKEKPQKIGLKTMMPKKLHPVAKMYCMYMQQKSGEATRSAGASQTYKI